jgi:hypothetical protein
MLRLNFGGDRPRAPATPPEGRGPGFAGEYAMTKRILAAFALSIVLVLAARPAVAEDQGQAQKACTAPSARPEGGKSTRPGSASNPSDARKAELATTLAKRRAFHQRYQGTASRQRATFGPFYESMIARSQAEALANSAET